MCKFSFVLDADELTYSVNGRRQLSGVLSPSIPVPSRQSQTTTKSLNQSFGTSTALKVTKPRAGHLISVQ